MPNKVTAQDKAFFILEVLKRIPYKKKVSTLDIFSSLKQDGFSFSKRTLQRTLKMLAEDSRFGVIVDTRDKKNMVTAELERRMSFPMSR